MLCASCGVENPPGAKFCLECGSPLARACAVCGTTLPVQAKFCLECGATVTPGVRTAGGATQPNATTSAFPVESTGTAAELRHVSVLFCDLVGFTPFSERRDPEEVRELLSGYFDTARAVVARYGGVVEKFIGDAVMAVWGAPVAREDDAERAVRAGLELVSAVAAYGLEHRTELQARVGIVTGSAATTTEEEGLVIGDRVNTAARIQSAAPPGCCYVDETTRASSAAAIAYRDAGSHELKGKAEPVQLYQATRVVAAVAGSQRSGVIEAPFLGRDRELHLVKELFHATAERRSVRMVLVSGVAGVGKSRLAWEFFKYIDGLAGDVLWHAGRCLSYGEGVSYWALSEMVRARLSISEEDSPELAAERLRTGLDRWIADAADREFIAPRLGQLLGLPTPKTLAKEELFAGWRLFFERLAEHLPVLMVIEDLQWADAGLVGFLDHLLEWSGDHAIFLLVLSRPEGVDRPGLALSRRSVTTLPLDALPDEVIGQILDGLVPGLPPLPRARIVERAEGIPLYAVETVRGLLDKGVLEKDDDGVLRLRGELGELEIPPGLTALIASRLDALSPDERRLVKECSVLGGSFPRQAVAALTDVDGAMLGDLLSSLVRKEVLTVRADKLSPERGQYAFTQSMIRSVAYDMLTRAERKARHLRTADHLRAAFPDEGAEVAEVIGAHLYDAYLAAGDDPDAGELRSRAASAYVLAAERGRDVGAPEAAEAAYLRAAELSAEEGDRAALLALAGHMAFTAGWYERAIGHFEQAAAAHSAAGRVVEAAQMMASIGDTLGGLGRNEEAIGRIRAALESLRDMPAPPVVMADLQASLARALMFSGHSEEAASPIEAALTLAEHYELGEQLATAMASKAVLLGNAGRVEEARALYEASASVAQRHGILQREQTAEDNLADLGMTHDLPGAEEHSKISLNLARRAGRRAGEAGAACNLMYVLTMAGRFDEAFELATELLEAGDDDRPGSQQIHYRLACLEALRGNLEPAEHHLSRCRAWKEGDEVQLRAGYATGEACVALAAGDSSLALKAATRAIDDAFGGGLGVAHEAVRLAFPVAVEAAINLREPDTASALVDSLTAHPRGTVPPFLRAQLSRARALIASVRGEGDGVEENLVSAESDLRALGYPYWTARTQLDRAEWLAGQHRPGEAIALATDALASFEAVGAAPMCLRARALIQSAAGAADAGRGAITGGHLAPR